ncbi:MAG: histone deacetylase [Solirubrobacterales bacterium]|nr:histone deacetylase [Solirubrobacterales bacterium]
MTAAAVLLSHPSSLRHETGAHPEQPARIVAIERELERREWLGYERVSSPAATREQLARVHPEPYIAAIERVAAHGGGYLDLDTVASEGSFEAAAHAAGGAIRLADMLLEGEARCGFSAHRPPGHHAEAQRAMGFCLFNNVAVAAQHAVDARGLERVMIFDWDVHHGNGTNDLFHASDRVLFVSIHQSPLYPGTGRADDAGSGEGRGYTVNLPVPPGTDDHAYGSLVQHVVAPLALRFEPQLVLISAGYDAHRDDPLADCRVTEGGFAAMTRTLRETCAELDVPLGGVLEGGYALEPLARSVAVTLEGLAAPVKPKERVPRERLDVTPLASQAISRLSEWWPDLR